MTDNNGIVARVTISCLCLEQLTALVHELETGVHTSLQSLTVNGLEIYDDVEDASLNRLLRVLMNKSSALETLHIANSHVTFETATCISNLLDQSLNPLGIINQVGLWGCLLGNEHLEEIVKGLKHNNSLVSLDLAQNRFGDAGALLLGEAIAISPSLLELNISGNDIGHAGAEAIAEGIMQRQYPSDSNVAQRKFYNNTQPCKEFELYICLNKKLNDIGATVFASLLHKQHSALSPIATLTKLNLSKCAIGDEGAAAIAESLKGWQLHVGLKELNLCINNIADLGAVAIANALKENKVLSLLNLINNCIRLDGGRAFCRTLEAYNDTLNEFTLDGNPCCDEVWKDDVTIGNYSRRKPGIKNPHQDAIVSEKSKDYCEWVKANKILKFISLCMASTK